MKYRVIIDEEHEDEIIIYSRKKTKFIESLCKFIDESAFEFAAYDENGIINLSISDIYAFIIENSKLYALTKCEKLRIKGRLYQIEELLDSSFVKINQSCIVNIKKIERFDTTLYGVLTVKMKNGYKDYVSRRQIKNVKERMKLKP